MWKLGSEAPTDGRIVLFMFNDGSGAQLLFFMHGLWWECSEDGAGCAWSQWHVPDCMDGDINDSYWCDLPPAMLAKATRLYADQFAYISEHLQKHEASPGSSNHGTIGKGQPEAAKLQQDSNKTG